MKSVPDHIPIEVFTIVTPALLGVPLTAGLLLSACKQESNVGMGGDLRGVDVACFSYTQ